MDAPNLKNLARRLRARARRAVPERWRGPPPPPRPDSVLSSTSNPQRTSQFFTRLPLEIRRQIYAEVLTGELGPKLHLHAPREAPTTHPVRDPAPYGPVRHLPCVNEVPVEDFAPRDSMKCCTHWCCHGMMHFRMRAGTIWPPAPGSEKNRRRTGPHDLLQAMGACRRLAVEAADVLYGAPVFVFSHVGHMAHWARSLPATHLCRVRSVVLAQHMSPFLHGAGEFGPDGVASAMRAGLQRQLEVWEEGLAHLRYFKGLVSLHIGLFADPISAPLGSEQRILGPVWDLKIADFVVELPGPDVYGWSLPEAGDELDEARRLDDEEGNYPFRIVRRRAVGDVKLWPGLMNGPASPGHYGSTINVLQGSRFLWDW